MDITLVSFVLTSILTVAIATVNEKPVVPVVSAGVRSVVTPNVEIWSGREGLVASGKIGDIQGSEAHHDIGLGAYGPPGIGPQSYESGEQRHHRRGVEQSHENGKHRQKQPFYPPPEFNNHHHGGGGGYVEQHHGIENYPRERQSGSHSREYGYPQEKSHRRHAISGETYGEYQRKRSSSSSSSSSGSSSNERSYHEEDRNSHKLSDDGNQYGISDDDDCDYVIIRRGSQQRHDASRFASRKHERHHHRQLPTKTVKIRCKSKKRHHHSNKSHQSYPKSEVITLSPPPTTTKKPTTTIAPTTKPPPPPTTNKPKSCPPSRKCPSYPRRSSASHSKSVEVRPCPHQQPCKPSSSHHSKSSSSEEHACPPPPPCPGNATSSHPKEEQDQHHHKSSSSSSDSHHDDYKPSPARKESSEQVHSKDSLERWKSIKRNKSESKSVEKKSHSASDEALSKWKPIYQLPDNYQQHRKSKSHSASKEASKSSDSHSVDSYSHLSKDNGCGELNLSDYDIEWLYRLLAANDLDKFFRFVEHKIYKRITRSSQRALHKLASVYSPNDDAKLFDMFKNSKYREMYQFLSKKHVSKRDDGNESHYSSSNSASSKSVLAALENEIYTVFGRVLIDRPAEKGHYFEVQNALLAAVIIVW